MWLYCQKTGNISNSENPFKYLNTVPGYSGKPGYKNSPRFEDMESMGPIPRGLWFMGQIDNSKGPLTIYLTPDVNTITFNRKAFRIHGDSINDPGNASEGCIILEHSVREFLASQSDHLLMVF